MTTAHGARSLSFLSPLSLFPPLYLNSHLCAIGHENISSCVLLSIYFSLKDVAVLEVPGMGCTAPVDKYYLKAPPLKGKHKITQHLAFVAAFLLFIFFCSANFMIPHLRTSLCVNVNSE